MKVLFVLLFCLPVSFFSLQFTDMKGNTLFTSSFQGKKILLVNIATGSKRASQIGELQQLQEQFGDKLVIIGFPSNSFGHETRTDEEIKLFCQTQYGVTYLLAAKNSVTGLTRQPIYDWLANAVDNGVMNSEPNRDFQKYLIDGEGKIVGVFSPVLSPLDPLITNAIKEN